MMNTADADIIMFDDWNFEGEDKVVQHKVCTDNTEHVEDNQEANISKKPSPSGRFIDVGKNIKDFINENTAKNTKKANKTVRNIFLSSSQKYILKWIPSPLRPFLQTGFLICYWNVLSL